MSAEQVSSFLRALEVRLTEIERDLRETEALAQTDRARDLRTERETVLAMKTTFLAIANSSQDRA